MLLHPEQQSITSRTPHSFYQALKKEGMSYICEVKKASPSKGLIAPAFPYLEIAKEYQEAGAAAISCLTEPFYFQVSDRYLQEITAAVDIPVLRNDFTVDEYMIFQAAAYGAAAVLLICAILNDEQLKEYRELAEELGMDALVEAQDEEEAEKNASLTEEELAAKKKKEDRQFKWLLYITVAISIVVSIAAFMLLPYALASLCRKVGASEFVVTIVEAFVKLALFMGYMLLISRMKDIQRTFMYHGAEHKCINCVEHGLPLTVENVLASSRLHKRCGTSFLFLVMIVSIFLHFIFVLVPVYWVRLFGRLLMVPIVAGISFEIIQWAGRSDSKIADFFSKPGLAMQKLTTKEPTADMAEVAIKAVEAVFDWRAYLKEEFDLEISYPSDEETVAEK